MMTFVHGMDYLQEYKKLKEVVKEAVKEAVKLLDKKDEFTKKADLISANDTEKYWPKDFPKLLHFTAEILKEQAEDKKSLQGQITHKNDSTEKLKNELQKCKDELKQSKSDLEIKTQQYDELFRAACILCCGVVLTILYRILYTETDKKQNTVSESYYTNKSSEKSNSKKKKIQYWRPSKSPT
jgi:hypothetical protein